MRAGIAPGAALGIELGPEAAKEWPLWAEQMVETVDQRFHGAIKC
jgi:hypothetical protein